MNRRQLLIAAPSAAAVATVGLPVFSSEDCGDNFRHYVEQVMRHFEPELPARCDHYGITIKRAFGPKPDLAWFEVDARAGQFGGGTYFWTNKAPRWITI